jgi:hypothetical protein
MNAHPSIMRSIFERNGKERSLDSPRMIFWGMALQRGTVYESQEIFVNGENKKVFLERLEKGTISLYRYTSSGFTLYYVRKDSAELVELEKDKAAFIEISQDCEYISAATQLASFNKRSLSNLVAHYNNCENKPFPYPKIGILGAWGPSNLQISPDFPDASLDDISFDPSASFLVGIYADLPIRRSYFSVNTGLYFSQNGFSANSRKDQVDVDVVVNVSTLQVPLLLRYTLPAPKWRPFLNIGGTFAYHVENASAIYESSITDEVILIDQPIRNDLVPDQLLMYSAGIGLQYSLDYRKTLSAEVRYSQSPAGRDTFGQTRLDLFIGFSF